MEKEKIIEEDRKNNINKYFKSKKLNCCREKFIENLTNLDVKVEDLVDFVFIFKHIRTDSEESRKTRWTCFDNKIMEENIDKYNINMTYSFNFILNEVVGNIEECLCETEIKNIYVIYNPKIDKFL